MNREAPALVRVIDQPASLIGVACLSMCMWTQRFHAQIYLKNHVEMVHENKRRYVCDVCGKAYAGQSGLKVGGLMVPVHCQPPPGSGPCRATMLIAYHCFDMRLRVVFLAVGSTLAGPQAGGAQQCHRLPARVQGPELQQEVRVRVLQL